MAKKEDRRKRYTIDVINSNLMALLKKKPLGKVSVTELCQQADISRCTFYAHFPDVYAVVESWEDAAVEKIIQHTEMCFAAMATGTWIPIRSLCQKIAEDETVAFLFQHDLESRVMKRVAAFSVQRVEAGYAQSSMSPEEIHVVAMFIVNGFLMLLNEWLKTGAPEADLDYFTCDLILRMNPLLILRKDGT